MPAVVLGAMPEALRLYCLGEVLTGGLGYGDVWRRACWLEDARNNLSELVAEQGKALGRPKPGGDGSPDRG